MERRRFTRFHVLLPVQYRTAPAECGESYQGQGLTRDVSLSGSYFHVSTPGPLKPGCIIFLTIAASVPPLNGPGTTQFRARGEVVRLEPPGTAGPDYGVAVNFLEGPSFSPA